MWVGFLLKCAGLLQTPPDRPHTPLKSLLPRACAELKLDFLSSVEEAQLIVVSLSHSLPRTRFGLPGHVVPSRAERREECARVQMLTSFGSDWESSLHATLTDLRDRELLVDSGRTSIFLANRSHGISAAPGPTAPSYEAV